jgi:hypothetical protein
VGTKSFLAVCDSCCNSYGLFATGRTEQEARDSLWTLARKNLKHYWNPSDPDYPKTRQNFEDYYGVVVKNLDETPFGFWNN